MILDVNEILNRHREYFNKGITKDTQNRINTLNKFKDVIKKNEALIIEALNKDLGKSEFEAYTTEIGFLLDSIKFMTKNLKNWSKPKKVKTPITQPLAKSYIYKEPYGTVLIIGPFNYPFQLLLEPLVGAIASGNTAVLKPSEHTPNVSNVVKKVVSESFDKDYVTVIDGGREETSSLINSNFDYIFFTGSVKVGKIVMEAASKNLIPVTLELGGKSPCIVDREANIKVAAKRIVWGKFMNAGQTCVAPDYVLAHKDIKNDLIKEMKVILKEFYGENPHISNDYGRVVNKGQVENLIKMIDKEKIVIGGDYDIDNLYVAPTVLDNVSWDDRVMEDEIFGPILPIIEYENIDTIISKINDNPKPLALYIFSEEKKVQDRLIDSISYGGGCINDTISHLATPYLPFGGVGNSGIGAYHGKYSYDIFSHKKSIMKKSTKFDLKFIFPPYDTKKVNFIKKVLK